MLKLLSRRAPRPASPLPVLSPTAPAASACSLSKCSAGTRATVLSVHCGDVEACRLRALGLCEGASVDVLRTRDCTLLEVRGTRLAVGSKIASGITVLPVV